MRVEYNVASKKEHKAEILKVRKTTKSRMPMDSYLCRVDNIAPSRITALCAEPPLVLVQHTAFCYACEEGEALN
jgi:hypothetical protein